MYVLVIFFSEDDHCFYLGLEDDVILDDCLIEVDEHVFSYHYLPFAAIFLLNCLLEGYLSTEYFRRIQDHFCWLR